MVATNMKTPNSKHPFNGRKRQATRQSPAATVKQNATSTAIRIPAPFGEK